MDALFREQILPAAHIDDRLTALRLERRSQELVDEVTEGARKINLG